MQAEPLEAAQAITASANDRSHLDAAQDESSQIITFRVQVCASSSPIPHNDPRFGGQPVVVEYIRNGLYKYAVGAASTRTEAEELMRTLRSGPFPDAFIVPFKGNEPWLD